MRDSSSAIDTVCVGLFSDLLVKYFRCIVLKDLTCFILKEFSHGGILSSFGRAQYYLKIEGNLGIILY